MLLPVVFEVKCLQGAHEIDVSSETADAVVAQTQMHQLRQRFQIIGNSTDPLRKAGRVNERGKDQ